MKIGIIGTGNMGRTLGLSLARVGHEVFFGARDLSHAQSAAQFGEEAGFSTRFGTNQEAAVFGEVIYFAVRDVEPRSVLSDVSALDGKVVFDSNNGPVPDDLNFPPIEKSRSEHLQEQLPRAKVVKAFNTMAQESFWALPHEVSAAKAACFLAGDDVQARETVAALAASLGFEAVHVGDLKAARQLEGAGDLIRRLLFAGHELGLTFSLAHIPIPLVPQFGGRQESKLT